MRKIVKNVLIRFSPCMIFLLGFFFQKKYLTGRHFENTLIGYFWAFKSIWINNILRLGKPMPFPTGLSCFVSDANNIDFHPDDLNNFQSRGTYFQNFAGHITIGKGTYIAPNVGVITANHDLNNLDIHTEAEDVVIGEKCWIGMNSIILPGVNLGDSTIVAAGSVVTKSFAQGNVVIAGVPAKIIKNLVKTK